LLSVEILDFYYMSLYGEQTNKQRETSSRSTLPTKHHRLTGFFCGWSVGVEFFAGYLRDPALAETHQTTFENVYVRFVLAHTAH